MLKLKVQVPVSEICVIVKYIFLALLISVSTQNLGYEVFKCNKTQGIFTATEVRSVG